MLRAETGFEGLPGRPGLGLSPEGAQWALFCSLGRWDTPGLAEWQDPCPYRPRAAGTVVRGQLGSGTHPWVDSVSSPTQWG